MAGLWSWTGCILFCIRQQILLNRVSLQSEKIERTDISLLEVSSVGANFAWDASLVCTNSLLVRRKRRCMFANNCQEPQLRENVHSVQCAMQCHISFFTALSAHLFFSHDWIHPKFWVREIFPLHPARSWRESLPISCWHSSHHTLCPLALKRRPERRGWRWLGGAAALPGGS